MKTGVGQESCHLCKNFSLLKRGGLVTFLSPDMFQFDRELEEGWFERVAHPK